MDEFISYIKSNLNLNNFTLIKTTTNKAVIFKIFNKYTKCIYINMIDESIEIKIHKVFDDSYYRKGIERLIISNTCFDNFNDSLSYIKKNIAI